MKTTDSEKTIIPQKEKRKKIKKSQNFFQKNRLKNSHSNKSIIKFWLFGGLFIFLGYLFFQSLDMIYLIFTAIIIAISMDGMILFFEKKIKRRGIAIGISYFLLFLFIISGVVFLIPFLISQVSLLISRVSSTTIEVKNFIFQSNRPEAINQLTWLPSFIKEYFIENRNDFNISQSEIQSALLASLNTVLDSSVFYLKQLSSGIFVFIGSFSAMLGKLLVIFTLSVFFSLEKKYVVHMVTRTVSKEKRQIANEKIDRIYEKLSLWLKARLLLSLFITVALGLSFWILKLFGISFPSIFSLALISGLLDVIPYVGPLLAFIPIVILALIHNGFWGMIIVGVVYLIVQWIQNNIVVPLLMEKQLGVNPILILISALIGGVIMGFRGIILSVPLAVLVGLFIDEQ